MGRPLDVLRDPEAKILVRRLAAMEGEELESKAPEIPPYVLAKVRGDRACRGHVHVVQHLGWHGRRRGCGGGGVRACRRWGRAMLMLDHAVGAVSRLCRASAGCWATMRRCH